MEEDVVVVVAWTSVALCVSRVYNLFVSCFVFGLRVLGFPLKLDVILVSGNYRFLLVRVWFSVCYGLHMVDTRVNRFSAWFKL